MKKLVILFGFILLTMISTAQNYRGYIIEAFQKLEAKKAFVLGNDTVRNTTKLYSSDTILVTKGYLNAMPTYAGVIIEPTITKNPDGTITISSNGDISFNTQANGLGYNTRVSNVQGITLTLPDNTVSFIYADYNNGNPFYSFVTDNVQFFYNATLIPVVRVTRLGTQLHFEEPGEFGVHLANKLLYKDVALEPFRRQTGLSITTNPTRISAISSGVVWYSIKFYNLTENIAGSQGLLYEYYLSGGNWSSSLVTSYDATYYSDGTDRLALSNNKYVAKYFFRDVGDDNEVYYIHGNQHNTELDAVLEGLPVVPLVISSHSIYVGKIVIKQGSSNGTAYSRVWGLGLTYSGTNDHASLNNLGWSASNHTDGPNTLASFDATGIATTTPNNSNNWNNTYNWMVADSAKILHWSDTIPTTKGIATSFDLKTYVPYKNATEDVDLNTKRLIQGGTFKTYIASPYNYNNFWNSRNSWLYFSGQRNVGIGYLALNLVESSNNVGIGAHSLERLSNPGSTTAVGTYSGNQLITGDNNSFYGVFAGFRDGSGNDLTSVSNGTYLGTSTKASANGVTNETVIGFAAVGAGSNTVRLGDTNITRVVTSGVYQGSNAVNDNEAVMLGQVKTLIGDSVRASEWNAAYNDKINSLAFSGTTTKTLTLTQQDGGTVTGTFTDNNTDSQTLSIDSVQSGLNTIFGVTISGGNRKTFIDSDTDAQDLTLVGNTLSLTNDATSVDLSAYVNPDLSGYKLKNDSVANTGYATNYKLSLKADAVAGGYLPLSGGTMSNTNLVTNMNADLFDSYDSNLFQKHSQYGGVFNANNRTNYSFIHSNYEWQNVPVNSIGVLQHSAYSGDWIAQQYDNIANGTPDRWIRYFYSGTTWTDWFKFYHSGNSNLNTVNWTVANGTDPYHAVNKGQLDTKAPATGSTAYIWNGTSQQTGNFNISGSGTVGSLTIPTTNATPITIGNRFVVNSLNDNVIALGSNAGTNSTNRTNSTFIGTLSAFMAGNISLSVLIGNESGASATDSYESTMIGYYAGRNAKRSSGIVNIGKNAGTEVDDSPQMVNIGNSSGYASDNSKGAIRVGYSSGFNAYNSKYSNFIGYWSGQSANNARYSNYIGYYSGVTTLDTNNIIIGTFLTLPSMSANSMNIGGVLFGTGLNSRVTGQYVTVSENNGKIGVNIPAPTQDLDVLNNARFRGIGTTAMNSLLGVTSDGTLTTNVPTYKLSSDTVANTGYATNYKLSLKAPATGSTAYIWNGTSQQTGASFNIDGNGTFGSNVTAPTFQSTVATGTPPLTVNSSTMVPYLNAQYLETTELKSFVYGTANNGSNAMPSTYDPYHISQYKSGFWDTYNSAWMPTLGYWWGLTVAHTSNSPTYNYAGQLAFSQDNQVWIRSVNNAVPLSWNKLWHNGNDGAGSTMDADLFDNINSNAFIKETPALTIGGGRTSEELINENTFSYAQGTPWWGRTISFGGANVDGRVDKFQITSEWNYGNDFAMRTYSPDRATWNSWRTLYHDGNSNNNTTNWTVKDAISQYHAINKGQLESYAAPISGSANYIQNQYSGQTANFWINGSGRIRDNLTVQTITALPSSSSFWDADLIRMSQFGGDPLLGGGYRANLTAFRNEVIVEKHATGGAWATVTTDPDAHKGQHATNWGGYVIATTEDMIRFTWTPNSLWNIDGILVTGSANGNYLYITVEKSADASTWETLHEESALGSSWPGYHYLTKNLSNNWGYPYLRVTIRRDFNNPTNAVDIGAISIYGNYGPNTPLFTWDFNRNINVQGVKVNSLTGTGTRLVTASGSDGTLDDIANGTGFLYNSNGIFSYQSIDLSAYVTLNTIQNITAQKYFSSAENHYNGHLYYDPYDAAGNHYPHYTSGSDGTGAIVNTRVYKPTSTGGYYNFIINGKTGNMQWEGDALFYNGVNVLANQEYKINGASINTAGTLTNVAYKTQLSTSGGGATVHWDNITNKPTLQTGTESYISNVSFVGNNLTFTGVGSAFNGTVSEIAKTNYSNTFGNEQTINENSSNAYSLTVINTNSFGQGGYFKTSASGTNPVLTVESGTADLFRVNADGSIKMQAISTTTDDYVVTYNPTTKYIGYKAGGSIPLAANGTRGGIQIGYSSTANNFALELSSEKAYTALPDATYLTKGIASFNSSYFTVSSGQVSIDAAIRSKWTDSGSTFTYLTDSGDDLGVGYTSDIGAYKMQVNGNAYFNGNVTAVYTLVGTVNVQTPEITLSEKANGASSSSGYGGIYYKTNTSLFFKDENGEEFDLTNRTAKTSTTSTTTISTSDQTIICNTGVTQLNFSDTNITGKIYTIINRTGSNISTYYSNGSTYLLYYPINSSTTISYIPANTSVQLQYVSGAWYRINN